MSKKDKKRKEGALSPDSAVISPPASSVLSKRGWKVVGLGIVVVVIGFFVLSFSDSRAQNLASDVSPFLIIGGYALIGIGIVTR